jgi:Sec7-like guanine-nucleotide exchange factor
MQDIVRALIYEDASYGKEDHKGRSPLSLTSRFNAIPRETILKFAEEGREYRKKRHLEDPATKAGIIQAIALFAHKPKKALELLVNLGVVANTPEDLAKFLLVNRKKLDKVQLGELLSDADQKEVMMSFVCSQDFRDLSVCERANRVIHRSFIDGYWC